MLTLSTTAAQAGPVLDKVKSSGLLRVCIWPDYYGITFRNPHSGALAGIDIDLSTELGKDLGAKIEYVDSSFATLIDDVKGGRCDVAMFAVGKLPQRMEHLRFTQPYLQSDVYGDVTTKGNQGREPVVRHRQARRAGGRAGRFPSSNGDDPQLRKQAKIVVVKPPATRERELEAGRRCVHDRLPLNAAACWTTPTGPP